MRLQMEVSPLVLALLSTAAVFNLQATVLMFPEPTIECGATPEQPANVTYQGHVAGIYVEGRYQECHSVPLGDDSRHVIFDVFSDRCGQQSSAPGHSVRVRLEHVQGLLVAEDSIFVLSCSFEANASVTARAEMWDLGANDVETHPLLAAGGAVRLTSPNGELKSTSRSTSATQRGDNSAGALRNGRLENKQEVRLQLGAHALVQAKGQRQEVVTPPGQVEDEAVAEPSASHAVTQAQQEGRSHSDLGRGPDEGPGLTAGSHASHVHASHQQTAPKGDNTVTSQAPLTLLQYDEFQDDLARRRTGYDVTTLSGLGKPETSSVLKLNVVDEVGDTPSVVVPGKLLALELHSSNMFSFGTAAVTRCRVTNPLAGMLGNQDDALDVKVIDRGCGTGDVFPRSTGFRRTRQGQTTPLFAVPEDWVQRPALVFSCDVIICAHTTDCKQVCPATLATSISPAIYDAEVTLESQIVTSCPLTEQLGGQGLSPPGCDVRTEVPLPAVADKDVNSTATPLYPLLSGASWLAQHLHYVLIICVLGLFIVIFMSATFLKMAAMQRHVCQTNKMMAEAAAASAAAAAAKETHSQSTQTARPLPSVPSARRSGRRDGDGETGGTQARHSQGPMSVAVGTVTASDASAFTHPELPDGAHPQPPRLAHVTMPARDQHAAPQHQGPALQMYSSPQSQSLPQAAGSSGADSSSAEKHSPHPHVHHVSVVEVAAHPQVVEVRGHSKPSSEVAEIMVQAEAGEDNPCSWSHPDLGATRPSSFGGRGGAGERGLVLGVNSLKRSMERDGYFSHRGNLVPGRDVIMMAPATPADSAVMARQSRDSGRAELGVAVVSPDYHRQPPPEQHKGQRDHHHKPHQQIAQETTRL